MEIIEEFLDPEENEPAILDLSIDKLKILEKRGFFPTSSGLIDDTYYNTRKELKRITHLKEIPRVQDLVNLSADDMEKVLFWKDSMMGMPVTFFEDKISWYDSFGSGRFYDVDPLCLEPHIAKYVRAINRSGMETFYSCDGWHEKSRKSREMVILFRDRYSWIWHKVLCDMNNIDELCCWEHSCEGATHLSRIRLPRADEKKLQIYNGVAIAADVIVENLNILKELRDLFLDTVYASNMDALSDCEVEKIMREYYVVSIRRKGLM